jgi:hypothetical protein
MPERSTESADGEKPWWCYICAELFPFLVRAFPDRESAEMHVSQIHGQKPVTNEERNARGY